MRTRLMTTVFAILALASLAIVSSLNLKFECPKLSEPEPCRCEQPYQNVLVKCSNLNNHKQLLSAFQVLKGHGVTELEVKDSNLSYIPYNLFKDSSVARIRINNSMLFYLFDQDLGDSAGTIKEIFLQDVDFGGGLDWSVLSELEKLLTLSVTGSDLENIEYGMSELELPIETLILSNNRIKNIYSDAFHNLKSLVNLNLKNNELTTVKRSMLPQPNSGIQFLDLSNNNLETLPLDMFDGMGALHSLILRGNEFTVLDKAYMMNVFPKLFYFDVADNPLKCSCGLSWILGKQKPYHFLGRCSTQDKKKAKNLKDLSEDDFVKCQ